MPGGKGSHREFSPRWEEEGPAGCATYAHRVTDWSHDVHTMCNRSHDVHMFYIFALLPVLVVGGIPRPLHYDIRSCAVRTTSFLNMADAKVLQKSVEQSRATLIGGWFHTRDASLLSLFLHSFDALISCGFSQVA
jgi:hypothetical protein